MTERRSITRTRIAKREIRRKKRSKFFLFTMGAISLIGITLITVVATKIYGDFQETRQWEKSALNTDYASIPPEFAKNVITSDMTHDVESLSEISTLLDRIDIDSGLTDSSFGKARELVAKSGEIFKRYHITGGEIFNKAAELDLYVRVYHLEKSAYTNPDSTSLSTVITKLNTKVLNKPKTSDKKILERLSLIIADYQNLVHFQDTYIPSLGTVSDGLVKINPDMTEATTSEMISVIDNQGLAKFENLASLKTLLKSDDWAKALKNNQSKKDKEIYALAEIAFNRLSKDQYISTKSLKTYKQVKDLPYVIYGADERDGYLLNDDSPVTNIVVDGSIVSGDFYIRKTARIELYITPAYTKIQESSSTSSSEASSTSSSIPSVTQTIPSLVPNTTPITEEPSEEPTIPSLDQSSNEVD